MCVVISFVGSRTVRSLVKLFSKPMDVCGVPRAGAKILES